MALLVVNNGLGTRAQQALRRFGTALTTLFGLQNRPFFASALQKALANKGICNILDLER
jgi:hypothetical protein